MSFQRIELASRALQARASRDVCGFYRYPQTSDWHKFHADRRFFKTVQDHLTASGRGLLALVGPHGSGKTFLLLYLGHWWEEQDSPRTVAYYATSPATLSRAVVVDDWRKIGEGRKCLWLLDDVHTDSEGTVRQLVEEFEALALPGHWLVTAGWSPKGLGDGFILRQSLTRETIRFALEATEGCQELADNQGVVDRLAGSRLGLRQVLWAARERPDLLDQTDVLEDEWGAHVTHVLDEDTQETLALLVRLKFLGLPFLPCRLEDSLDLGRIVRQTGFVDQLDTPAGSYEISDDEIAQVILRQELAGAGNPTQVASAFVLPLRRYLSDLLNQRRVAVAGRLLHAVRFRTRRHLTEWIEKPARDKTRLIDDLLDDGLLTLLRAAVVGHETLSDAARVVAAMSWSRSAWARETAIAMLEAIDLKGLSNAIMTDLPIWRALARLANLAENAAVRALVSRAAHADGILHAFRLTTAPERGKVLSTAQRVSEDAYRRFLDVLCEVLVSELQAVPPRGAWRRLATLAHRGEASVALTLLESLGLHLVTDLVFAAPSAARQFLAGIGPERHPDERERLEAIFDRALSLHETTPRDVERWAGPQDLISLVVLARRQRQAVDVDAVFGQARQMVQSTNPVVLTNLSHDVAKFGWDTQLRQFLAQTVLVTLREGKDPLVERAEALARLDPRLLTEDLLATLLPRWRSMDPDKVFRLLWLAVAVSSSRCESRRELAREIVCEWEVIAGASAPLTGLAVCGLCMFVLGGDADASQVAARVSLDDLREPSTETTPPTSPQLTACQLLALARRVSGPTSLGYRNLAWLVKHVSHPSRRYHRAWHRMVPASARRLTLEILRSALDVLASSNLAPLAKQLGQGVVIPEQDDIWDDHLAARVEVARLGAGSTAALRLLERRCDAWVDILQRRMPGPDGFLSDGTAHAALRFLTSTVDLAEGGEDPAKVCVRKLLDAATPGLKTRRHGELVNLRVRLGAHEI